jgi:tripartite ATP-independent transporter DctP family solute receptor
MKALKRARLARAMLLACAVACATAPASARTLRAADNQVEDYPTVQALFFLDRTLQERSGGRHRLQVFHSRQLGEEKETIEQMRAGAIDLARVNSASMAGFVPELDVLVLPFLFRSTDHAHRVLDGPIGEEILGKLEAHGFVGLAFYDSGARSFYNAVRPIRTPEDLKGLRIRVQPSALAIAMVKALGAVPVPLPYGQVATGLSTGLIDGAENNWPSYVSTGHYRAAPHYALTEHTMGPEVLAMSRKAWDGLDAEEQAIFREAAKASSRFMRERWRQREEAARAQAEREGSVAVTPVDRAPFAAAMAELYDRLLAERSMAGLVERIRKAE